MHSIGIIAAKKSKLVKLTGKLLVSGASAANTARLNLDGTHDTGSFSAGWTNAPGEWYAPGATTNIGDNYQIRWVSEAGSSTLGTSGGFTGGSGNWGDMGSSNQVSFNNVTGRFRIEIRDKATSTLQASAQFWTAGFAP